MWVLALIHAFEREWQRGYIFFPALVFVARERRKKKV